MIYLFEDRLDRMKGLCKFNLDAYKDVITYHIKLIDIYDSVEDFVNSLIGVDTIIIHSSYDLRKSKLSLESIRDESLKKNINFVKFSGGANSAMISENEAIINSGVFYANLESYLIYFRKTKNSNLPNLVFGNSNYLKNQIKQFQNEAMILFLQINDNIENDKKILRELLNKLDYLKSKEFNEDKSRMDEFLKKEFSNFSNETMAKVKQQTKKMIKKISQYA
jgi:hypothetical protein